MKTLIVLNGELKSPEYLKKLSSDSDFVICADGGYDKAKSAGVKPDVLIGDMDSVECLDFDGEIYTFPSEKDETDCELAIRFAIEKGADEVILTCALGGRYDHALANLSLLLNFSCAKIMEKDCVIFRCTTCELFGEKGKTFSIIPFTDTVVSLESVKYPTEYVKFSSGTSLGISNEFIGDTAKITVHEGKALIFINE